MSMVKMVDTNHPVQAFRYPENIVRYVRKFCHYLPQEQKVKDQMRANYAQEPSYLKSVIPLRRYELAANGSFHVMPEY